MSFNETVGVLALGELVPPHAASIVSAAIAVNSR